VSFTVLDCEQRSAEWFAARVGVLTATGAAAMLSKPRTGTKETAGKRNLRLRLALEALRGTALDDDEPFESKDMRRGRALEPAARGWYEAVTGEIVQTVGFVKHDTLPIGCSPDGIVGDYDGGLELKCPIPATHWEYVEGNKVPSEYAPQILHSLYVTGLPWWDFCSYCPEFDGAARLFRVRVTRADVDLDSYALALALFLNEVEITKTAVRERSVAREESHAEGSERSGRDVEEDERQGGVLLGFARP
jgi:hypothetical protein